MVQEMLGKDANLFIGTTMDWWIIRGLEKY